MMKTQSTTSPYKEMHKLIDALAVAQENAELQGSSMVLRHQDWKAILTAIEKVVDVL